jgi:hypothetical protein
MMENARIAEEISVKDSYELLQESYDEMEPRHQSQRSSCSATYLYRNHRSRRGN